MIWTRSWSSNQPRLLVDCWLAGGALTCDADADWDVTAKESFRHGLES